MIVKTIADITPNGAATALSASNSDEATWINFVATGNSCRVGDSNVSSSRGQKLPAGVLVTFPRAEFRQGRYRLSQISVFATSTDAISITYGD